MKAGHLALIGISAFVIVAFALSGYRYYPPGEGETPGAEIIIEVT